MTKLNSHINLYLQKVSQIASLIDANEIAVFVEKLAELRERNGRLFLIGVGGSAANCSHAVNDFRKLTGIEAYTPSDNVAELTARTNDEGWETIFSAWLQTSHANKNDAIMVLSVGGGNVAQNVSVNIVHALDEAKRLGLQIFGIVGRDGGYTKKIGSNVIVIPTVDESMVTPHTESFQAVIWHCLVCHPALMQKSNKWEQFREVEISND